MNVLSLMSAGAGPVSVALVAPRTGIRRWQVDGVKRAELAGAIRVDALLEVDGRPNAARDAAVGLLAALESIVDWSTASTAAGFVPAGPHAPCCARAAWPDVDATSLREAAASGGRAWALLIDLSQADGALLEPLAALGVLRLRVGRSSDLDDVLRRLRLGHSTIELSATLCRQRDSVELAHAVAPVHARAMTMASLDLLLTRAMTVMTRAILIAARSPYRRSAPNPRPAVVPSPGTAPPRVSWNDAAGVVWRAAGDCARLANDRLRGTATWFLAYRESPQHFIASTLACEPSGLTLMMPPPCHSYADPCVLARDGADHVFFEDYDHRAGRGVISWMQRVGPGVFSAPETVLERSYHLSYPFVFESGGDVLMIPETSDARQVQLFKAVAFPRTWTLAAVLLDDVNAVDATVVQHGGRWWMFVSVAEARSSTWDELYVYYADAPFGPWHAHAANPVKSDVRSARPAGRLFRHHGRLIRPAQNCSQVYGGSLVLCEVLELTPSAYREVVISELSPEWAPGSSRFHTLSSSERVEFIDGCFPPGVRPAVAASDGRPRVTPWDARGADADALVASK